MKTGSEGEGRVLWGAPPALPAELLGEPVCIKPDTGGGRNKVTLNPLMQKCEANRRRQKFTPTRYECQRGRLGKEEGATHFGAGRIFAKHPKRRTCLLYRPQTRDALAPSASYAPETAPTWNVVSNCESTHFRGARTDQSHLTNRYNRRDVHPGPADEPL